MTKKDLFRKYDAIRCTEDRRKIDELIEQAGVEIERLSKLAYRASCPPHPVNFTGVCQACGIKP